MNANEVQSIGPISDVPLIIRGRGKESKSNTSVRIISALIRDVNAHMKWVILEIHNTHSHTVY